MEEDLLLVIETEIGVAVTGQQYCTQFIQGALSDAEIATFEETNHFRVEVTHGNTRFRLWIMSEIYRNGLEGMFW